MYIYHLLFLQFELHFYIAYQLRHYQLLVILPAIEVNQAAQETIQELNYSCTVPHMQYSNSTR